MINKFEKMEGQNIPDNFDYGRLGSLSNESREKLEKIRPNSLGQAARISGVRNGDLTILMLHLEKFSKNSKSVSHETL